MRWFKDARLNSELIKPDESKEVPIEVGRALDEALLVLETEIDPLKLAQTQKEFFETLTPAQMIGYNLTPYWDRYQAFKKNLKSS